MFNIHSTTLQGRETYGRIVFSILQFKDYEILPKQYGKKGIEL